MCVCVCIELTAAMQRHVQMRQQTPSVRQFVRASAVDRSTQRINLADLIRKVDFQISRGIPFPSYVY